MVKKKGGGGEKKIKPLFLKERTKAIGRDYKTFDLNMKFNSQKFFRLVWFLACLRFECITPDLHLPLLDYEKQTGKI